MFWVPTRKSLTCLPQARHPLTLASLAPFLSSSFGFLSTPVSVSLSLFPIFHHKNQMQADRDRIPFIMWRSQNWESKGKNVSRTLGLKAELARSVRGKIRMPWFLTFFSMIEWISVSVNRYWGVWRHQLCKSVSHTSTILQELPRCSDSWRSQKVS